MTSLTYAQLLALGPCESAHGIVTRKLPDWGDRAVDVEEAVARGVTLGHLLWVAMKLEHCKKVATFAADCAERVLPKFEAVFSDDSRPREAISLARSRCDAWRIWAAPDVSKAIWETWPASKAAAKGAVKDAVNAAKAAAKAIDAADAAAFGAVYAAGYAVRVATYAANAADDPAAERAWQRAHFVEVFNDQSYAPSIP